MPQDFPWPPIRYCLDAAGLKLTEVDHVAIPRNPWARLGTKLFYAMRMPGFARERAKVCHAICGHSRSAGAKRATSIPKAFAQNFTAWNTIRRISPALFCFPYDNAALLSADGLGDFASTMWATGKGNRMRVYGSIAFPHSLGMYYTALTQYLGFWKFGDEYKVMGLAAYGQPEFLDEFRRIVTTNGSTGFRLGLDYFTHHRTGPEMSWRESGKTPVLGRMFSEYLERRMGATRPAEEPLTERHHNIAATMQARARRGFLRSAPQTAHAHETEIRLPGRRRSI